MLKKLPKDFSFENKDDTCTYIVKYPFYIRILFYFNCDISRILINKWVKKQLIKYDSVEIRRIS